MRSEVPLKEQVCDEGGCSKVKSAPTLDQMKQWFPPISKSIHMGFIEFMAVAEAVIAKRPCNFLVFGAGHDSALWRTVNFGGRTVFLEDAPVWLNVAEDMCHHCEAHYVHYDTFAGWDIEKPTAAQYTVEKHAGSDKLIAGAIEMINGVSSMLSRLSASVWSIHCDLM